MGIFDKVNDASRGMSEKAKNMSEIGNLKRKILYEEERIVEIFADIGRLYYKGAEDNQEQIQALCEDVTVRRRRIKKMKLEFYNLKGSRVCPNCNAEVNDKFQFCGNCGAKIPQSEDDLFFEDEMEAADVKISGNSRLAVNPTASV